MFKTLVLYNYMLLCVFKLVNVNIVGMVSIVTGLSTNMYIYTHIIYVCVRKC